MHRPYVVGSTIHWCFSLSVAPVYPLDLSLLSNRAIHIDMVGFCRSGRECGVDWNRRRCSAEKLSNLWMVCGINMFRLSSLNN